MSEQTNFFPAIKQFINSVTDNFQNIPEARKPVIGQLTEYLQSCLDSKRDANLNFICTHNSRRSQFGQVAAHLATHYYPLLKANAFSGGTEVTAFNERAVAAVKRIGLEVSSNNSENPVYELNFSSNRNPITAFSKVYDDSTNTSSDFAAIMTCSHADDNCPHIPGALTRIPLRYEDPKAFDDTALEVTKYDERLFEISTEIFYAFSQLK